MVQLICGGKLMKKVGIVDNVELYGPGKKSLFIKFEKLMDMYMYMLVIYQQLSVM